MESHLSDDRLLELATHPEQTASQDEETHLENCSECVKKFIELVRKLSEN